jgi:xanthine dehydrogenase accessory factor
MKSMLSSELRIVIRGGGEMGSGVAWRPAQAGFRVMIAECAAPLAVRRWVCFSEAICDGVQTVADVTAHRVDASNGCPDLRAVDAILAQSEIAILIAPELDSCINLKPDVLIDATLKKTNIEPLRGHATLTIGLGPGFVAGRDVDYVIETNRGPNLGKCIQTGSAEPDTGIPGVVGGQTIKRVLRAANAGELKSIRSIGDRVNAGDPVASIAGVNVVSELDGILRGLIRPGAEVTAGQKIGDVDPRGDVDLCRRISDKALAIAGGVIEAIAMQWPRLKTDN